MFQLYNLFQHQNTPQTLLINRFVWVLGCVLLWGCDNSLSPSEYAQFLADENNGFRKKITLAPYQLQVEYQPSVYTAYRKSGGQDIVYKQKLEEDKELNFFNLNLGLKQGGDLFTALANNPVDYQSLVYYFSYSFQKGIFLQCGDKKYPCVLYHFERSYDLQGSRNFVLGFENEDLSSSPGTLIIEAKEIGIPYTEIPFQIDNIPDLTF